MGIRVHRRMVKGSFQRVISQCPKTHWPTYPSGRNFWLAVHEMCE